MSKASMSVIKRGTAMVYKFSEPVTREEADAMIAMHKKQSNAAKAESVWSIEFRRELDKYEVMQGSAHRGLFDSMEAADRAVNTFTSAVQS